MSFCPPAHHQPPAHDQPTALCGWVRLMVFVSVLACGAAATAEQVTFLEDDTAALAARLDLIAQSRTAIDLAIFQTQDDPVGLGVLELLRQAALRGVRVRIVLDAIYGQTSPAVRRCLLASGVEIRIYHRLRSTCPLRYDHRLHDKLLIGDGQCMIVGGRNLTDGYFGRSTSRNYIDLDLRIAGQEVQHAADYFNGLWNSDEVDPDTPGCGLVRLVGGFGNRTGCDDAGCDDTGCDAGGSMSEPEPKAARTLAAGAAFVLAATAAAPRGGPTFVTAQPVRYLHTHQAVGGTEIDINAMLLSVAASARREIVIEAGYLVLIDQWETVLRQARGRGVAVTLIGNSLATTDQPLAYAAYANQRRRLLSMGVRLYEFRAGPDAAVPRTLHAKSLLIDDWTFVGSFNVHPRSHYEDSETGILMHDSTATAALRAALNRQIARSFAVTRATYLPDPTGNPGASPAHSATLPLLRLVAPLHLQRTVAGSCCGNRCGRNLATHCGVTWKPPTRSQPGSVAAGAVPFAQGATT